MARDRIERDPPDKSEDFLPNRLGRDEDPGAYRDSDDLMQMEDYNKRYGRALQSVRLFPGLKKRKPRPATDDE